MNVLLVNPKLPTTYWGFQLALPLAGRRTSLPPLGLISLAAMLDRHWDVRLVDMNARPLSEQSLDWADVVMISGMHIQRDSMQDVVRRASERGCVTVVGGPSPTTTPEAYPEADIVFVGEAEGRGEQLMDCVTDCLTGQLTSVVHSGGRHREPRIMTAANGVAPEMTAVPTPRFDLLRIGDYASMSIQYSRGCPYSCEFCDIVAMFGHRPRVKSIAQVQAELDALYNLGWRGSVFFVDDNFIGNKKAVQTLLPMIADWQRAHDYPFELYTEASVNLAADPALMSAMVDAGFTSVFLGIETPSTTALAAANKKQNLRLDLHDAVSRITARGLEVMGGFIVGFDQDEPNVFDAQAGFIGTSPIPLAMVGLLTALPGTALWARLEGEGRLRGVSAGDQFGRPNFEPAMDETALIEGYAGLLAKLYTPEAYFDRCHTFIDQCVPIPGRKRGNRKNIATLFRTAWSSGVRRPWRREFWQLIKHARDKDLYTLPWAVGHAVMGEHMIRYTHECVLPRLGAITRELRPTS